MSELEYKWAFCLRDSGSKKYPREYDYKKGKVYRIIHIYRLNGIILYIRTENESGVINSWSSEFFLLFKEKPNEQIIKVLYG